MSGSLVQYIQLLNSAFLSQSPDQLYSAVPLSPDHPLFSHLRTALSAVSTSALLPSAIAPFLGSISPDVREGFTSFVLSLLRYVKVYQEGGDFGNVYERFMTLVGVYTEVNKLYAQTSSEGVHLHPHLNPIILSLAKQLVSISNQAAASSPFSPRHDRSARSIRDTTRQIIERSFQVSSTSLSDSEWVGCMGRDVLVGDIMWGLANVLWRIYAARKLHTQAADLVRTFAALQPAEEKRIHARPQRIPQTDICQAHYWRGRLGVVLLDMRNGRHWLDKAWEWCPSECWQQRRAILIRVIPVNLLLGRLPSFSLLDQYNLHEFSPLLHAFKSGNLPAWRRVLEDNREWFRRRSIWLVLFERGEILLWRNLFRFSVKTHYQLFPSAPRNRCPTRVFLNATRAAFSGTNEPEDDDITLEDIICVLSSLIDQVSHFTFIK
ncbi:hypothetical protein TREMEDRAFT_25778 [Tremella mesenterica DSM 1558]|uniref:uncharacterized protein n=1 Tax=Tremella mesenterica (strain ATCC 24925 / CBS 8224 / DSM 1558 / NBRC 9311 / NRRL Y-6157 / RJB 2259-6 / UBC 559-6) TaxID=578456 RepID=UPI0003F49F87|nr:uncharacterized protein TREMEDRAFT_25778 [Tremella mesenterica DSM 1558]EIW72458.1 hypothetical protein TREMEDRAFT_25778 [Tremella mesenterica DSM 1558]